MIKALVLDFDDTICMTEEACFALENEVLGLMGATLQSREIHQKTWGQSFFEAIKVRSPGVNVQKFKQLFEETMPSWIAEGRLDFVSPERLAAMDAAAAGKELYILTSRTHIEVKHLLQPDHELAKRVKAFYWHDIMEFHKPDPRAFVKLLREHGLTPQECLYVGDSPGDAAAAKQAGLYFIASLESGLRTKADFKDFAVDSFINHLQDLPEAAAKIGRQQPGRRTTYLQ